MEGKRFIRTIRPQNILSYGPDTPEISLEPLNVLIGLNASGKSNLIDILSILQAAPRNLPEPIRLGGGTREWLWKGRDRLGPASLEVTVEPHPKGIMPLRYKLSFTEVRSRFQMWDEAVENETPQPGYAHPFFYYGYQEGNPVLNVMAQGSTGRTEKRYLKREEVHPEKSILSQRRDPDTYPELTYLAHRFERIGLYRDWRLGPDAPHRLPQKADLPQESLMEDGLNLGLVLNDLMDRPPVKRDLLNRLQEFYPNIEDVNTKLTGGAVEVTFHEESLQHPIPATRQSDGSLRYLSLLMISATPIHILLHALRNQRLVCIRILSRTWRSSW